MRAWDPRFLAITVVLSAALGLPRLAGAQEVSLAGTVSDTTGAVLPGVTVTALHVATGSTFVSVTDASGGYRFGALRVGVFRLTTELAGFNTVRQENVELRVGQRPVIDFTMTISSLRESITVTGQAPLVDVSQSKLAGSFDPRQVESLPINGRNWMQLTQLMPGSRTNAVQYAPIDGAGQRKEAGSYQINLDGQQVTQSHSGSN